MGMRAEAFANDYQRMWDLVRYKRSELLNDGLITLHEYAVLAAAETVSKPGHGSPSPRRLESYDEMRKRLAALESGKTVAAVDPVDGVSTS